LTSSKPRTAEPLVPCAICRSSNYVLLFTLPVKDGPYVGLPVVRGFFQCADCSFVSVDLFEPEKYRQYYMSLDGVYYRQHDADTRRYQQVAGLLQSRNVGRVLDWGCGTGKLLSTLSSKIEKFGVEPSAGASVEAREKGVTILSPSDLESRTLAGTFDAITIVDVVEHVRNLDELRQTVARLLRKGGVLIVVTGSYDSPPARRLGKYWYYLHYGEHISFFNEPSMRCWLDPDFDSISIASVTHHPLAPSDWLMGYARFGVVWLARKILREAVTRAPKLIAGGDHMLVCASRKG